MRIAIGIIVQIVAAPAAACSPDPPIRCPAPPDSQAQILVIVIVLFVIVLFRFMELWIMLDDLLEQRACPWLRARNRPARCSQVK